MTGWYKMNDKELLEAIEKLGFAENEAKCYLALFKKNSLTASETAKLSGVPRQNTYKTLEKLLAKGLIVSIPGEVKRYAVSDPHHLKEKSYVEFRNSVENDLRELEKRKKEILEREFSVDKNMEGVIQELDSLYKVSRGNGNPLDYIQVLKNPEQIHRKFLQLVSEAKTEILIFSKPPYSHLTRERKIEQLDAQEDAAKRGVRRMRGICQIPTDETEKASFLQELHSDLGPNNVKVIKELPIKLALFDKRVALFTLEDPIQGMTSLTALVTEHQAMAGIFVDMFESRWEKATPVKDYLVEEGIIKSKRKKR
jgi:HTH-type transcriptional regulator, sugar sensing transcriptional regulator